MTEATANLSADLKRTLDELDKRLQNLVGPLKLDEKRLRLEDLDEQVQDPDFWSDQDRASVLQKERSRLQNEVETFDGAKSGIDDCRELIEMAEGDSEGLADIQGEVEGIDAAVEKMEFARMLGGENDPNLSLIHI